LRAGHIFNLGHGVPPDADPAVLASIVELVHNEGAQLRREAREELAGASAAGGRWAELQVWAAEPPGSVQPARSPCAVLMSSCSGLATDGAASLPRLR